MYIGDIDEKYQSLLAVSLYVQKFKSIIDNHLVITPYVDTESMMYSVIPRDIIEELIDDSKVLSNINKQIREYIQKQWM